MINKLWRKFKAMAIAIVFALAAGCAANSSRQGTAMDHMKAILKGAEQANTQLAPPAVLPTAVSDSLKATVTVEEVGQEIAEPEQRYTINTGELEANKFFLGLVQGSEIKFVSQPNLKGKTISPLHLKAVTIHEVLDLIKNSHDYGIEVKDNMLKVYPPADLQTRTFMVNYLDMTRSGSSQTKVSSSGISSGSSSSSSSEESSETASTESSSSSGSSGGLNSEINTSSSRDLWGQIEATLKSIIGTEGGRKISISRMTGMIVVHATPEELLLVEKFLKDSETFLNRQVILEAKVLEVELNDMYRAGINWGILSQRLNASQLGGNVHTGEEVNGLPVVTTSSSTSGNPSTIDLHAATVESARHTAPTIGDIATPFGGVLTLGLNYSGLASFVELLSSQGNVQVLSNPRISTSNNQKALIKVGTDEYFVTNITVTQTVGTSTTATPEVEFQPFFSGIALDVTPHITEDGHITLHIHPTVSTVSEKEKTVSVSGANQVYPLAKSAIRESDSIVRAKDGQFVVIGGLMQDRTAEIVTGVPLVKDIPYLGALFRQTRQQSKKTELVILLRPMIVKDEIFNNDIANTYKRFDKLDLGFHVGGNVDLYGNLAEVGR